jgi:DNA modification methylase
MSDILDGKNWHIENADCIEHMATMPDACIDFSVFSPPFPSLYAYTSHDADIGNSEDLKTDAKLHLSFFYRQFARILKPGRAVVVHVMQIPRMKRSGGVGLFDFRGLNIRLAERAGLVYEYDWAVRKNPQSQAIRTKSRELQFSGLESDRAKQRGALADYLIKFRAPGDNKTPIRDWEYKVKTDEEGDAELVLEEKKKPIHATQVSRNEWIQWAECTWGDIRETDTLNLKGTKGDGDTKHICPLQLQVIDRLVRLYSNPGEIVFTPFAGIGSEVYQSIKRDRRAYGIELKKEYYQTALKNAAMAESENSRAAQQQLF